MKWLRRLVVFFAGWRLFGPIFAPSFRTGQSHPWPIPGRTVFAGSHEYFIREAGHPSAPPVVLIHGLGGSSITEWYKVGKLLAERYRVIMVDHRSHGLSPKVTQRFEVGDVADDVAAVMGTLGLPACAVAGYSMGGTIVQALAHHHPALVRKVALVATFAVHPTAFRWPRMVGVWLIRGWERATGIGSPEARAAYLLAVGAVDRRYSRWLWEETHRRDPEAGAASSFALLRFDSRAWIGSIAQPALVVIPSRDQLVPVRWQYDLAARLADARVVEIEGAHHEVPWTHPEQVADALIEFFEKD